MEIIERYEYLEQILFFIRKDLSRKLPKKSYLKDFNSKAKKILKEIFKKIK